ncbi:MAG: hypothetical protein EOO04_24490 [Chitinophagaceae bacterium]|nr:MAG: hypothetical protein EOO04_24490 [Chitinophagaceae bacterium]
MSRLLLVIFFTVFFSALNSQTTEIANLLCNNSRHPSNIDNNPPRFSWQFNTSRKGFMQSAFRLIVSDTYPSIKDGRANTWNSGKITSDQSINVAYRGRNLLAGNTYYWSVTAWDNLGKIHKSYIDSFTTALFDKKDWSNAQWIGYEELPDSMRVVPGVHAPHAKQLGNKAIKRAIVPLFRKEFRTKKPISKATAYVTGLGQYEFMLNGQKAGNSFLAPAWTFYDKRVQYNVLDVTSLLSVVTRVWMRFSRDIS